MTGFIQKLFGKKRLPSTLESIPPNGPGSENKSQELTQSSVLTQNKISTLPLKDIMPEVNPVSEKVHLELPQLLVGAGHSVGKQRDHNEDSVFTLTTTLVVNSTIIPFGVFIIADGMGGHQHGEVASSVSVRAMVSYIIRKLYLPIFGLKGGPPEESFQEIMREAVFEAHRAILKEAAGGGTTITAALIMGEQITIAHVGDSRAYAIHANGRMQALTRDHSLVKRLEELGQITNAEAAAHPQRNVLYRALGQGEPFEPDVSTVPVPHSGYMLMCSDGLWGVLPDKEILDMVITTPNPQSACQSMVHAANQAGGPDNISVILIQMPD